MEPPMNPLPSFSQIQHVKRLYSTDLFSPATIARSTGVPLRDIFRIARPAIPADTERLPAIVTTLTGKTLNDDPGAK